MSHRRLVESEQPGALIVLRLAVFAFVRYGKAGGIGERDNCVAELQPVGLHDKVDDRAVGAAAEAMVKALLLVDREGGGLLLVKRAQAEMFAAFPDQRDAARDDRNEVDTGFQLIEEFSRYRHAAESGSEARAAAEIRSGHVSWPLTLVPALAKSIRPA